MRKNTESDNWGQLLSDFGIEDQVPEDTTGSEEFKVEEPAETAKRLEKSPKSNDSHEFGTGLPDSEGEIAEKPLNAKDKKSIFSRFPKMNFFGAPPEVSLDAVIEGVKSPSLGGKAFTDNRLEKMPLSQEWADRQEKNVAANPDAFSAVASQIDVLASGRDTQTRSDRAQSRELEETKSEERPARRHVSSMFDDPIPESEEFRALKDIMGEPPSREETHRAAFIEGEKDSWKRGRERGVQKPYPKAKEAHGRGARYRPPVVENDLSETDFEPVDDDMPRTRGRGRHGSRYASGSYQDLEHIQDDVPQEEWSEVDVALQSERGESTQRGSRHQRNDKRRRPERTERSAFHRESSDEARDIAVTHGNVPSWDDTISDIIAANISRHKSYAGRGRR